MARSWMYYTVPPPHVGSPRGQDSDPEPRWSTDNHPAQMRTRPCGSWGAELPTQHPPGRSPEPACPPVLPPAGRWPFTLGARERGGPPPGPHHGGARDQTSRRDRAPHPSADHNPWHGRRVGEASHPGPPPPYGRKNRDHSGRQASLPPLSFQGETLRKAIPSLAHQWARLQLHRPYLLWDEWRQLGAPQDKWVLVWVHAPITGHAPTAPLPIGTPEGRSCGLLHSPEAGAPRPQGEQGWWLI